MDTLCPTTENKPNNVATTLKKAREVKQENTTKPIYNSDTIPPAIINTQEPTRQKNKRILQLKTVIKMIFSFHSRDTES